MENIIIGQGESRRMNTPDRPVDNNPLTRTGKEVMTSMTREYGQKKGKQVFYASINKNKKGSGAWHKGGR